MSHHNRHNTGTNDSDLFQPHIGCHHLVLLILADKQTHKGRERETDRVKAVSSGFRPEENMKEVLGGLSEQTQI